MTTFVDEPSATASEQTVRPESLLARADHRISRADGIRAGVSRRLALKLLGKMSTDVLTIRDHSDGGDEVLTFGTIDDQDGQSLHAAIDIYDSRAWTALVAEGSIGLGRGYIEGWWDSDDPVAVVRIIIRNLEWADDLRNRITSKSGWATDRIRAVLPKPDRSRNKEDIASHYDLGNEFFEIFLDETLTYSSAIFPSAEAALAEASQHKYDRLLSKLGVAKGQSILEIGTGWGGFALRAVDTTGCRVTTTTISDEQLSEATRRVHAAKRSDDVTLLDADWRDLNGQFDRVVSIEMIEAVDWRDYDRYFATIERCMKPDGACCDSGDLCS